MPENTVVICADEYEALIRAKVTMDLVRTVVSSTNAYHWEDILPNVLSVEVKKNVE